MGLGMGNDVAQCVTVCDVHRKKPNKRTSYVHNNSVHGNHDKAAQKGPLNKLTLTQQCTRVCKTVVYEHILQKHKCTFSVIELHKANVIK